MKKFYKGLFINNLLFVLLGINILLFLIGFLFYPMVSIAKIYFICLSGLFIVDIVALFIQKKGLEGTRKCADRFSNGDENPVSITIENNYGFKAKVTVIDELPFQFQVRDFKINARIDSGSKKELVYYLRPIKRGEYEFGVVNVFIKGFLGLVSRRFIFEETPRVVKVYPSFLQMRKYELMAISNRLSDTGIKKIRRLGHNLEFEQIKEYVPGDDVRTINWKATARRNSLMVNQYQDEKSQQVYCVIDKGRAMKMPFNGMTLLDYAINASLVLSDIALKKDDKAGLITYSNKIASFLSAQKKMTHLNKILDTLYKEKTAFLETDNESLYQKLKLSISQRSLIVLFTNYESLSSMKRQLPHLRRIAKDHLLVVIFFENTEIKEVINKRAGNTEEIYIKTIAEKFAFEKKIIAKELASYGIHPILTTPENLTVNTINKYLEIKARNLI